MYSGGSDNKPDLKELGGRITNHLLTALQTLSSLNLDISLYLFHHTQNVRRDPFDGNGLDEAYTMYEERANDCRRLWMKLRAASAKQATWAETGGDMSPSRPRLEKSPSPLEYQSALDDDELIEIRRRNQVTPMEIDPVEPERPSTPANDPSSPKLKPKKVDTPTSRGVIVTPSGPTRCRLAPIPKGVKLSVEKTRIPVPSKPFTFNMPQQPIVNDPDRRPLNRTKHVHRDTHSSKSTSSPSSSLQSSNQQVGSSTAQTSVSVSPKDYPSAKEYWKPRRKIRPTDFQMDDDRLYTTLDCLGPPFQVNMADITHNNTPAIQADLSIIYGGKLGLTPQISRDKLAIHGFNHWMTPNMEFHPFLPARPGWPGLMLRADDELEEWRPAGGSAFRVVIRREPQFLEYVGQYEMVWLSDITVDEWKQQPAKVKKRWTQILGGGQSSNDTVARVSLRKKLGKEPSIEDLKKFADKLTPGIYAALAKDLEDDVDRAFCKGEEVITVWGMKCVGYDYKFEKHLAHSLKEKKPSLSGSAKRRKVITKDGNDAVSVGGDEEQDEDFDSDDSPSKRQRTAKGKAKLVKYDWSDARVEGDSEDEDYSPS